MTSHGIEASVVRSIIRAHPQGALEALLDQATDLDQREMAALLAQCAVECPQLLPVSESLNYTPSALRSVFGMRSEQAQALGRTPAKPANQREIANLVYNGRMGNRLHSNDGWTFRGRGLIQITGRNNYAAIGARLGVGLVQSPDLALDYKVAARIALTYWDMNNLKTVLARPAGIDLVSSVVNRGNINKPALHEVERRSYFYAILEAVNG